MRRYFGTDGVRGIVGRDLTPALVERLGRAVTLWQGGGAVLIGRDTRASGRELERAFASGVASAGGNAMLAGVLPTPGGRPARTRPRRRHLRLAQPARVQRRQALRRGRPEAHGRGRGADRGAPRRGAAERRRGPDRQPRHRPRQLRRPRHRALRRGPRGAPDRRRLRQRRLLGHRAGCLRAAGRAGDRDRRQARRRRTSTSAAAPPTCAPCNKLLQGKGSTSASRSTGTATGCWRSTSSGTRSTATRSWPSSRSSSASTSSR